jgi:hypothetical protein
VPPKGQKGVQPGFPHTVPRAASVGKLLWFSGLAEGSRPKATVCSGGRGNMGETQNTLQRYKRRRVTRSSKQSPDGLREGHCSEDPSQKHACLPWQEPCPGHWGAYLARLERPQERHAGAAGHPEWRGRLLRGFLNR